MEETGEWVSYLTVYFWRYCTKLHCTRKTTLSQALDWITKFLEQTSMIMKPRSQGRCTPINTERFVPKQFMVGLVGPVPPPD